MTQMPDAIREAFAWSVKHAESVGVTDPAVVDTAQITLVGWSNERRRITRRTWSQKDRAVGFELSADGGDLFSPYDDSIELPPEDRPITRESIIALARQQRDLLRRGEVQPGTNASGGRLVAAEVSRDAVTTFTLCDLDAL